MAPEVSEQRFTASNTLCPRTHLWHATDAMAPETEVADFMYALVRLLKPGLVLETGCYLGFTAVRMAQALKENGYGRLVTCDIEERYVSELNVRSEDLPLEAFRTSGVELLARFESIDLAFIDSGGDREKEVRQAARRMGRFGVIVLHDTAPNQTESGIPKSVGLPHLYMNTPRGLTLFQVGD